MEFKTYSLKQLANIKYGKNQKKVQSDCGTIPIYGTGGLLGYALKSLYDKPSVLIGRKGSIGKVKFVEKPFWTVDTLFYTEVNEDLILPKYLFYLMSRLDLNFYDEGTAVPSLRTETLNRLEFTVPPITEQKKILAVLNPLDEKIELNNSINKNLEEQARTVFKSWFINSPEKNNWKRGTFAEIFLSTAGGDWGKEKPAGNFIEKVFCIRGADIPNIIAGDSGKMPVRFILPKNFLKKKLTEGDIVIEISGGSPTQSTGRVAIISQPLLECYGEKIICTNFCRAIKIKHGYSVFAYYYLKYLYDKKIFFGYENGTTVIKNLNLEFFANMEEIFFPPIELIERFNKFCEVIFGGIFSNGAENKKLAEIREALLPKLLSGNIKFS